jgi:hypothetical protein
MKDNQAYVKFFRRTIAPLKFYTEKGRRSKKIFSRRPLIY